MRPRVFHSTEGPAHSPKVTHTSSCRRVNHWKKRHWLSRHPPHANLLRAPRISLNYPNCCHVVTRRQSAPQSQLRVLRSTDVNRCARVPGHSVAQPDPQPGDSHPQGRLPGRAGGEEGPSWAVAPLPTLEPLGKLSGGASPEFNPQEGEAGTICRLHPRVHSCLELGSCLLFLAQPHVVISGESSRHPVLASCAWGRAQARPRPQGVTLQAAPELRQLLVSLSPWRPFHLHSQNRWQGPCGPKPSLHTHMTTVGWGDGSVSHSPSRCQHFLFPGGSSGEHSTCWQPRYPCSWCQELPCQTDSVHLGSANNRLGDLGQVTILSESLGAMKAMTKLPPPCCCSVA